MGAAQALRPSRSRRAFGSFTVPLHPQPLDLWCSTPLCQGRRADHELTVIPASDGRRSRVRAIARPTNLRSRPVTRRSPIAPDADPSRAVRRLHAISPTARSSIPSP